MWDLTNTTHPNDLMSTLASRLDKLASSPLFADSTQHLSQRERASLSYRRAKAISSCFELTVDDILKLRPRFWDLLTHPICCLDPAAATLLAIQFNLVVGTLVQYLDDRPDLSGLVDDLLSYKTCGTFMLSEIGHGLDAPNLETTATYTSGGFELHTPRSSAAKFMPPTIPTGQPLVGLVFARLMVDGEDRGVKPFIVPLNNGKVMNAGVSAKLLPYRGATGPVNHSITTFTHLMLPEASLLGSMDGSPVPHLQFLQNIWRVSVGTISAACSSLPAIEVYATIGTRYSLRRTVGNPPAPILQFRTQQQPILTAVAQAYVLRAYRNWAIERFADEDEDFRVRHAIATCFKAVMIQHSQASCVAISERCGAQGILDYNQLVVIHAGTRGLSIAEGDILALSIRLCSELLLGRYELHPPVDEHCLLARHERGLFDEQRRILSALKDHRSPDFNRKLLPQAQFTVESIGHRMAYEAAVSAGVDKDLIALYEADIIRQDPSWYLANAGLTRETIFAMHDEAMESILPRLQSLVDRLGVGAYVTAPICSDEAWAAFVDRLEVFGEPQQRRNEQVNFKARL